MSDYPAGFAKELAEAVIRELPSFVGTRAFVLAKALLSSEAARKAAEEKLREWKWEVERRDDIINSEVSLRKEAEARCERMREIIKEATELCERRGDTTPGDRIKLKRALKALAAAKEEMISE